MKRQLRLYVYTFHTAWKTRPTIGYISAIPDSVFRSSLVLYRILLCCIVSEKAITVTMFLSRTTLFQHTLPLLYIEVSVCALWSNQQRKA